MPTHEECTERRVEVALLNHEVGELKKSVADIKKMVAEIHDDNIKAKTFVGAVIVVTTTVVSTVWAVFTYFFK